MKPFICARPFLWWLACDPLIVLADPGVHAGVGGQTVATARHHPGGDPCDDVVASRRSARVTLKQQHFKM